MRIGARLTRAEFAFLSGLGTTSRTRYSEYLLWLRTFFMAQKEYPNSPSAGLVNFDQCIA